MQAVEELCASLADEMEIEGPADAEGTVEEGEAAAEAEAVAEEPVAAPVVEEAEPAVEEPVAAEVVEPAAEGLQEQVEGLRCELAAQRACMHSLHAQFGFVVLERDGLRRVVAALQARRGV